MGNKILIFIARYLCYASNASFAEQLATEFNALGVRTEICNLLTMEDAGLTLAKYIDREYLAVLDFNSTMPRAMAGKERFLDRIEAPFYDYIVDHPLYHHPILKLPLKNFHAICVDRTHAEYARKHYPHLKSVSFVPLTGIRALTQLPFSGKKNAILFAGTYYPPEKYAAMIEERPTEEQRIMWEMTDQLLQVNARTFTLTPEEAFYEAATSHGAKELPEREIPVLLNRCYPADIYVRALQRKQRILELARAGLPLWICGNDWELCEELKDCRNVTLIDGLDYNECQELIASFRVLCNLLPGFVEGTHDRIFQAMANGVVALTDTNRYIEKEFTDGVDCLYLREDTPERLAELMRSEELMEGIAAQGRMHCESSHCWRHRARTLLEIFMQNAGRDGAGLAGKRNI